MDSQDAVPHSAAENKRGDEGLSSQKRQRVVAGCGKQYPAQRAERSIRDEVDGPARREQRVFRLLAPWPCPAKLVLACETGAREG